ncbi:MAG: penicillin acylase family protein [Acidobacteriia bacterium]|nr:penicillin acylase family protein [Terriglobia bacterium]
MAHSGKPQLDGTLTVMGIEAQIEILRDRWGVPHIYANSVADLFFGQGFAAAQDRLYQMEMWRRTASGELSAILGIEYLERDRMARLMRYRGNMDTEWSSYGKKAGLILESFTSGINAYIEACGDDLPPEFQMLDFRPRPWKPEDCLLRQFSPRITYNTTYEIARAEMISEIGLEATLKFFPTEPHRIPFLDPEVDLSGISSSSLPELVSLPVHPSPAPDGSNCWAVDGTRSATGKPLLASDPHRSMLVPSLRYLCHLVAPGWNLIGSGEPHLPGVALGHNEQIAFGFTVAPFDQADLYVETLSPHDRSQYRHGEGWRKMEIERDWIKVKGKAEPVEVTLKFTRHGPVVWEDAATSRAIAIRWTGSEPGTAAYLGCLELDQAQDWESFRQALRYWRMPAENIVYADVHNNIGWVAAGMLPLRRGWDGLLPVSGHSDRFEWNGFLPIDELPQQHNPSSHFVATANNNILPPQFPHHLAYDWKPPYRVQRISEVLRELEKATLEDFKRLQHDEHLIPARDLIDLLMRSPAVPQPAVEQARQMLGKWNCVLAADSGPALLFKIWAAHLRSHFLKTQMDKKAAAVAGKYLELPVLLDLLHSMQPQALSELLCNALESAVAEATARFGADIRLWRWGTLHKVHFQHPLAKTEEQKELLNTGSFDCGGDDDTVNSMRGPGYLCQTGPSHRQIIDLSDWDRSVFLNIPGQSGDPYSPHYRDHIDLWQKKEYAPMLYTRAAIEQNTIHWLTLVPAK